MKLFSLNLFGSFEVRMGRKTLKDFPSRKVQALLIYLVVERDQPQRREKLFTILWPGMPEKSARHNLRQALYQLNQSIPDLGDDDAGNVIPLLVVDRQKIQLNTDVDIMVDILQFQTYLEQVWSHEHSDLATCAPCREALEEAIALYRGDFLAHFYLDDSNEFEDWSRMHRENSRREVLQALDILTQIYLRERNYDRAQELCERQLELDPLRESAHQQIMAVLTLSDQRPQALAQYDMLQQLLKDELGVAPSEKTRLMYEQLLKGQMPFDNYLSAGLQTHEARTVGACPYRGLAAFREMDALFFFGRESFTEQLYAAVQSQPLVTVIVGPSGAGKSSVLHAGLLPKLREADGDSWLIAEFRPGSQPFQSLSAVLLPLLEPALSETERLVETRKLAAALQTNEIALYDAVKRVLALHEDTQRLLILIDQFEELYTLCPDPEMQQVFLESLLGSVRSSETDCDSCLVLLNTLRADFMGLALGYRPFADALQEASLMLGPMTREELQAAIETPAELQGAAFETGLVERLLDDVDQSPGTLPLLEFALTLLWENMEQGWLTHAAYESIGRVAGALATYADQVFVALKPEEQEQTRKAFMQLVQPGQGTEDTRRIAVRTDLVGVDWSLIQLLADKRLVVTGLNDAGSETVEVVHEALIRSWGQLQTWMVEDRAFRTWQEGLRAALRSWETSDRDEGALLRGVPLGQAEEWLEARGEEIGVAEQNFIQASVDFQDQREAERSRRRRLIVGSLAVGLVVALVLSAVAFFQWQTAEKQANISLANSLMAQSGLKLEQPDLALLLSLEAHDRLDTPQTKGALLDAIQNSPGVARFLIGHTKGVESVAVSPDGRIIASVEPDGVMRLWELATGQPLEGHHPIQLNYVEELAFSPECVSLPGASAEECRQILAAVGCVPNEAGLCDRDEILLWDMTEGDNFGQPIGEPISSGGVLSVEVVFSPDGQTLATWGCTGTTGDAYTDCSDVEVVFWDVPTIFSNASGQRKDPIKRRIPNLGEWFLQGLDYNPDGTMIAVGGCAETIPETNFCTRSFVYLFETATGQLIWEASFMIPRLVVDVAFSPDGTRLAAGGCGEGDPDAAETGITNVCREGILVFLDAATGEVIGKPLKGHLSYINSVAFSPDGHALASGSADGTILLWDVKTGETIGNPLTGHAWDIYEITITPDGHFLVSASEDSTVGIWDLSTHGGIGSMLAESDDVLGNLAYSPDGSILAVGDVYGAIHLWDTSTRKPLDFSPIQGHEPGLVWDVAFSPDGKMLASAGADNVIHFWDPVTGNSIGPVLKARVTDPNSIGTFAIDFSPDGNTLVTSGWYNPPESGDPQIYVWDVPSITTGEVISRSLTGHPVPVLNIDFSSDGSLMVSSDFYAVVNMWNTDTWEPVVVFTDATALSLPGIRFSPDGKILAGGTASGEVHLWDVRTLQPLYPPLTGYQDDVGRVSFSPDGETLAAGSEDEVRLWDVPTGQPIGLSLTGQSGNIWNMVFHPDGHTLATSSRGGTVYLWDVDIESWRRRACELAGRNFTQVEWAQYLPDVPYHKTCPQWPAGD